MLGRRRSGTHAKGLELLSWIDGDLPGTVSGDCTRVRQVLTNLVSNAVKFTAAGEVRVEVTRAAGMGSPGIRFEGHRYRIGIGAASVDRVFDSFSQADGSTTREYGGTGLGLAISKQLVGLMGGQIGVESIGGEGSAFWFSVPLKPAADEPAELVRAGLGGARVLAIDDNATSRGILVRQLLAWGAPCDTAADGEAALELLLAAQASGAPYDLVLLDAGMPGTDEAALTAAIRSSSPSRAVPILMLISLHGERETGATAGADGFVTKPISRARLHDGIARALNLAGAGAPPDEDPPGEAFDDSQHAGTPVLLAEDNEINRLVAVRMLEQRGLRVDVAVDGRAALEMWASRRYGALFVDCQMPELDGYEVTAEIRRREGLGRHVPIVAMTANAMEGDRERCLAAGMDDYVGKPIDPGALDAAIARSLHVDQGRTRSAPLLDRSLLEQLCAGDTQTHEDLVGLFATESQSCLADIARAVGDRDAEAHCSAARTGSRAARRALARS